MATAVTVITGMDAVEGITTVSETLVLAMIGLPVIFTTAGIIAAPVIAGATVKLVMFGVAVVLVIMAVAVTSGETLVVMTVTGAVTSGQR